MEFLNKPMSEVWKSTKQTFSEIMDFNDSVISRRQPPSTETAGGTAGHAGGSLGNVGSTGTCMSEQNGSGRGSGGPSSHALTPNMTTSTGNQETVKPRKEKNHQRNSFSKTSNNRRPVSEDICKSKKDDTHSSSETLNSNQQKQQSTRHSLNTPFGKINFRNLNMMNLTKSDTTSKKVHHVKTRAGSNTPTIHVSMDIKPANVFSLNSTSTNSDQPENEKSLRTHRTHSHGRSHQGSFSESSHFRSNSTDRASVMKKGERKGEGRHSYHRSVSDEGALSDQGQPRDEEEDSDDLSTEKVKTKFLSMWNNMKYGKYDEDRIIWRC